MATTKKEMMADRMENITIGVSLEYIEVIALQAELESIKARVAAMFASNSSRQHLGLALAYGEDTFGKVDDEFIAIAKKLYAIAEELKARREQEKKAEKSETRETIDSRERYRDEIVDDESGLNSAIEGPLVMTPSGVFKESESDEQGERVRVDTTQMQPSI